MNVREIKQGAIWFCILFACRAILLAALTWATHGHEFTSDAIMHLNGAAHPGIIVFGQLKEYSHFPPLLPVALWVFITPWRTAFSDFVALRMGYVTMELAAWPLVWASIVRITQSPRWRAGMAMIFVFAPVTWMTSVVMAQEDILHLLFAAGICHLVLSRRFALACVLAGVGMVFAKIFFVVPMFIIGLLAGKRFVRQTLLYWSVGAIPVVCCYSVAGYFWWKNGIGFPLGSFTPPLGSTQSIWLLLHDWTGIGPEVVRPISGVIAGGLVLAIAAVLWRREPPLAAVEINAAWCMVTTLVFCTFYETMAEYFVLVLPAMMFAMRKRMFVWVSVVVLSLPWAVNFFYGVQNAKANGGMAEGSVFVRMYDLIFFWIKPVLLKQCSLIGFVVASVAVCVMMFFRLRYPPAVGAEDQTIQSRQSAT